jgi:hypothetical protein
VIGGPGSDRLISDDGYLDDMAGGPGSDTFLAADVSRDSLDCHAGIDTAYVDAFDPGNPACEVRGRIPS